MSIFYMIGGLAVLLVLSAFFSGSETALTALGKIKLKTLLEKEDRDSSRIRYWAEDPNKFLAAILIGNNAVNIGASVLATYIAVEIFRGELTAGIAWAVTFSLTLVVIIFCELAPKMFARANPEATALKAVVILKSLAAALSPVINTLTRLAMWINRMLGVDVSGSANFLTAEDVKSVINIGEEEGVIEETEREMLEGVFDLKERTVREVMIPRTEMFCIESNSSLSDVFDAVVEGGHSRIPVYEEEIDNIVGILYAKDLLKFRGGGKDSFSLKNLLHQPYFVPETKNISVLLGEFQSKKIHMAIVVDEYGGTEGLVTLEDLLEEIVGEIQDEHDYEEEHTLEVLNEDEVLVYGRMDIGHINDELDISLPETEGVETLGGMIVSLMGRVPAVGEETEFEGLRFRITEATRRRIGKVKISGLRDYRKRAESES